MMYFKKIAAILIILFTSIVIAQSKKTIHLWTNEVPGELEAKHIARVTKNTSGNVTRLTDVTDPILTVFKPERPNSLKAGIIVCPGGGYNILAINKEGYEIAEWLNKLGYTAFVLQYRVPKKQEGAIQDLQRAIKIVRSKASEFNLNRQKIGLIGFSAGGHLSTLASTNHKKAFYEKQDAIDEFSSRSDFTMLIYPAYLDKGENKSIDPVFELNKSTPPFFIFGTADDHYGNSSLVLAQALRNNETPIELHMVDKGGHGYGLREGNPAAETWPKLAEKWLNTVLKTKELEKQSRTLNFPKLTEYPKKLPKKKDVWVFIMAGQSNMAGRGFVEPKDTIPFNRILTINKQDEIIKAKEPLSIYEPHMIGLDCGMSFAKNLLEDVPGHVSILLIPAAIGGSSITQWIKNDMHREVKLLSNFEEKVALAKKHGQIKGILWHQGESDSGDKRRPNYEENMTLLFDKFRAFVGNNRMPILVGELGAYSDNKVALNKIINTYALKDKNTYIVKTSDIKDKGDNTHFNSEGQRIMGKRFADIYMEILNK